MKAFTEQGYASMEQMPQNACVWVWGSTRRRGAMHIYPRESFGKA